MNTHMHTHMHTCGVGHLSAMLLATVRDSFRTRQSNAGLHAGGYFAVFSLFPRASVPPPLGKIQNKHKWVQNKHKKMGKKEVGFQAQLQHKFL